MPTKRGGHIDETPLEVYRSWYPFRKKSPNWSLGTKIKSLIHQCLCNDFYFINHRVLFPLAISFKVFTGKPVMVNWLWNWEVSYGTKGAGSVVPEWAQIHRTAARGGTPCFHNWMYAEYKKTGAAGAWVMII